ncbi:MAG: metal-dependent hydrolase [Candidatus Hermodarchaeota archaeon]
MFHAAFPLLLAEIPQIKKFKINKFSLLIGSLLPDIIDKPIFLFGLGNGRFFSHNLLFIIISFLIVHLISKRKLHVSFPFLVGLTFHMLLDLPYVPLFYPFVSYNFISIEEPLQYWLKTLLTNPFIIITEVMGVLGLFFIFIKNKLYYIKEIMNYLKGINYEVIQKQSENNNLVKL